MKQVDGYCGWCGKRFVTYYQPGVPMKRYCSKKHKERASNARKNLRTHLRDGVCSTPSKLTYLTREAAERVILEKPTKHKGSTAYKCGCGFWHLGHVPKGVHSKERLEQQREWWALTEEEREEIRRQAYEAKMAKRLARA